MTLEMTSQRFAPADKIPVQPMWVSGSRAYAEMAAANIGAFVAVDGTVPVYMVTAWFLRASIERAAKESGLQAAGILPVSGHLFRFFTSASLLREDVMKRLKEAGSWPIGEDAYIIDGPGAGGEYLRHRSSPQCERDLGRLVLPQRANAGFDPDVA
jgi:hypothetical protein